MTNESTTVFVPGHLTGFFTAHQAEDPLVSGSTGGGITLTDGVTVTVAPSERSVVAVDGTDRQVEPADRVLSALSVTARVSVSTDVPIGAGFGVSGAIALGVAYGVNATYDLQLSENELIRCAHRAEVRSGTGLGDVVAQAHGGIPLRVEPGAPGFGSLDAIPEVAVIEYLSFGELSTASVLDDDIASINHAGATALEHTRDHPTLQSFMAAACTFARESGLLVEEVEAVIDTVEGHGGTAAMGMLGRTVFAREGELSEAGYNVSRAEIAVGGVRFC